MAGMAFAIPHISRLGSATPLLRTLLTFSEGPPPDEATTLHRWRNPVRIVGALMSMRAQKWARQFETRGYLVEYEYAHFARSAAVSIIPNSMVGHPLESLPVPLTQNIMSTCIIILRTGGCVWAFRRIVPLATKILWGHCPPK